MPALVVEKTSGVGQQRGDLAFQAQRVRPVVGVLEGDEVAGGRVQAGVAGDVGAAVDDSGGSPGPGGRARRPPAARRRDRAGEPSSTIRISWLVQVCATSERTAVSRPGPGSPGGDDGGDPGRVADPLGTGPVVSRSNGVPGPSATRTAGAGSNAGERPSRRCRPAYGLARSTLERGADRFGDVRERLQQLRGAQPVAGGEGQLGVQALVLGRSASRARPGQQRQRLGRSPGRRSCSAITRASSPRWRPHGVGCRRAGAGPAVPVPRPIGPAARPRRADRLSVRSSAASLSLVLFPVFNEAEPGRGEMSVSSWWIASLPFREGEERGPISERPTTWRSCPTCGIRAATRRASSRRSSAQAAAGLSTVLIHVPSPHLRHARPFHARIVACLRDGLADLAHDGDEVHRRGSC